MKKVFVFFSLLFILTSSFTIRKVDNSSSPKNSAITGIDKNWEIIAGINKFYIQKVVKSNLPIKSITEFSVEKLSKAIGVSEEKINSDIAILEKAAADYISTNKISNDCESCSFNKEEKQQRTLVVLNKLRDDKVYSDNFFKNAFSLQQPVTKVLEDDGGCQRWISYTACCAACVIVFAEFPPLVVLCAAACYCEYCCGGCC